MLKFLQNSTWEEIFQRWKAEEGNDPDWIKVAKEIKGWPDWESWRRHSASFIQADKRKWAIYEILDPMEFLPTTLIGPFANWQKFFKNKNTASFSELFDEPKASEFFGKNKKILALMENFPSNGQFIGLKREDNGKIILLEGHHRAAATALAEKQGRAINFKGPYTIALTSLGKGELSILDEALVRGSTKLNISKFFK
ncbi:hypothetical protein KKA13_00445 [Patescibacteria group bacterium]|nr:hypothetical protein [Patescibacteria group bacterium]MBU1613216.1 hypothetical protein [Patescibacteria group bacterium]